MSLDLLSAEAPPIQIPKLSSGTLLHSETSRYRVLKTVRKCDTYNVYLVRQVENKVKYEAKVESLNVVKYARSLKNEIVILQTVKRYEQSLPQLTSLIDKGDGDDFRFVITPHYRRDIEMLYKIVGRFTKAEWFKLSKEMLKAIEQFHSMSLAHGAIRLDAFAVTSDDSIVLTDFALARNNPETEVAEKLEFYNPPNVFSSRAVHENVAVCCADDMESWAYCIFSLYDRTVLPWNTRTRRRLMLKYKKKFFLAPEQIAQHHNVPTAFGLFLVYISEMKRNQLPNHSHFYKILNTSIPTMGITGQETFHWHEKGAQLNDSREVYQPRNNPKLTKHSTPVRTPESCTGQTKSTTPILQSLHKRSSAQTPL